MNHSRFFRPQKGLDCFAFLCLSLMMFSGCKTSGNTSGSVSDTAIIAEGATPQLISKQFSFTEGPSADKEGNIFFTDQPNNKIWKYDTEGKLSIFMDSAGRSNGTYFDKKGNLLTCADENNQLWSISKDKKVTVLLSEFERKKLNGPNDLWVAPNGDIYFTDPYYQRPWWQRKKPEIEGQHVYLLRHNNKTVVRVLDNLEQPNGIVGTPDGRQLYVADIKAGKTYRYNIQENGLLTGAQLFAGMGSDGMTLDNRGNLYLTGDGVTVFNKDGKRIEHIKLPGWTANVAFGGKKKDELFVTSSPAVYTLKMKVRGVE